MEVFWLFPLVTLAAMLLAAICARKNRPVQVSLIVTFLLAGVSAAVVWIYSSRYGFTVRAGVITAAAAAMLCLIGYFLWKASMLRRLRKAAKQQERQPLEYAKIQNYGINEEKDG